MSLFGALYSSVSGIQSQSTAIGIISDNISNVNTTGYKAGSVYFDTLVTNSGSSLSYSPGGVRAQDRQLVTQQGLVQTTDSPLDMAISGNGFFVVSDAPSAAGSIEYTRAGSFRTDSLGNFVNPAGLYLKAWPLDANGNIPTNGASLASLDVVNIGSASGKATATSSVTAAINLNSSQTVYPGAGGVGKPGSDTANTANQGITDSDLLVPNANMKQGDDLGITVNGTSTYDFVYGGIAPSSDISASPILGSGNATVPFSSGVADGDSFTITLSGDSTNPRTFKFVSSSPNTSAGEFNSLATLADAINKADGLSARVATVGGTTKLYIAGEDARQGLTFASTAGSTANFPTALGLSSVAAVTTNRFATLDGLQNLIKTQSSGNVTASIINANTQTASIQVNNADPLTTLKFTNVDNGGHSNFLTELGLPSAAVAPTYDGSSTSTTSMASGNVTPAFSREVTIYDSLGQSHDLTIGFLKTANNTWRAEIYANPGEIANGNNQIGSGKIQFNSDGSLSSIDSSLTTGIGAISWSNGAISSSLDFDFGTAGQLGTGKTDGLSQYAGSYNVSSLLQNGASAGLLNSVSIDDNGYIVANFSNGQTQKLYKIPLADFTNPDGMISKNGNAFIQSFASGEVNLKEAGSDGAGTISPSSLESSNADLSSELTNMIVAQRAYEASAKVITTANQLLDELNKITQ